MNNKYRPGYKIGKRLILDLSFPRNKVNKLFFHSLSPLSLLLLLLPINDYVVNKKVIRRVRISLNLDCVCTLLQDIIVYYCCQCPPISFTCSTKVTVKVSYILPVYGYHVTLNRRTKHLSQKIAFANRCCVYGKGIPV